MLFREGGAYSVPCVLYFRPGVGEESSMPSEGNLVVAVGDHRRPLTLLLYLLTLSVSVALAFVLPLRFPPPSENYCIVPLTAFMGYGCP